jgi:hypothetical protein
MEEPMTDRPDDLDPCPPEIRAFLESRYPDGGTSTWATEMVSKWVMERNEGVADQVMMGLSEIHVEGPDARGRLWATVWDLDTGALVVPDPFSVHYTDLLAPGVH